MRDLKHHFWLLLSREYLQVTKIIYAISSDGLLFKFLAKVNGRFKTPLLATAISGVFAGNFTIQ